jgi:hypothetical protein
MFEGKELYSEIHSLVAKFGFSLLNQHTGENKVNMLHKKYVTMFEVHASISTPKHVTSKLLVQMSKMEGTSFSLKMIH